MTLIADYFLRFIGSELMHVELMTMKIDAKIKFANM